MKKWNTLTLITAFVVLLGSCSKKVKELPDATQNGSNTFGAKVDGTLWAPKGFGIVPTAALLEARSNPNRDLFINARNFASSPVETELEIYVKHVVEPGVYPLSFATAKYPSETASYAYYVKRNITPLNEWMTNTHYTGSVTITKADTVNNIFAGTFQFNAINLYNTPQAISVTEGRFDIKIP